MTNLLLSELSNQDIDWMLQTGTRADLAAGTMLLHPDQTADQLFIVLQGALKAALAAPQSTGSVPAVQLSSGEMVGTFPLLESALPYVAASALTEVTVLALPRRALEHKLQEDLNFAAHLYRVSAQMLANRLEAMVQQLGHGSEMGLSRLQLKEASTVFAELQDQDLDWLIAVGQVRTLEPKAILQRQGRPVDALHILLEGAVTLRAEALTSPETPLPSPLLNAFEPVAAVDSELAAEAAQEIARLSRGDLVGETVFLDALPPAYQVQTLRECQVLSVPRWRLESKLLYDDGFAARIFRILALLLANKQQLFFQQLGILAESPEISSQLLNRLALAEARFEWMVKRIQSQVVSGRELKW
ncbi:MAG TPA: cyclic nucleotide-binding domain-containing protein [Trichocoleus sp.]